MLLLQALCQYCYSRHCVSAVTTDTMSVLLPTDTLFSAVTIDILSVLLPTDILSVLLLQIFCQCCYLSVSAVTTDILSTLLPTDILSVLLLKIFCQC